MSTIICYIDNSVFGSRYSRSIFTLSSVWSRYITRGAVHAGWASDLEGGKWRPGRQWRILLRKWKGNFGTKQNMANGGRKLSIWLLQELLLVISQSLPLSFRFLIVVSNTNLSRNASCNQRIRSLAPFHPDTA